MIEENESDYRPRLSVELTQETFNQLQQILPHGWRRPLFQALVDGVLELYKRGGMEAVSLIIAKHISTSQVVEVGVKKDGND